VKVSNPKTVREHTVAHIVNGIEMLIRAVYLDIKGQSPTDFMTKEAMKDNLADLILKELR
jgi:hypothetical protein